MSSVQKIRRTASVSRRQLMGLSHIDSIVTYHKCMKQLVSYGYAEYVPLYNPFIGSGILLKDYFRKVDTVDI